VSKSNGKHNQGGDDASKQQQPPPPKPGEPAPAGDESRFLAQQATDAKAAMSATLADIGRGFGQSVNVGAWTREYPWITLGASAVAGFAASAVLVPSKEDQALKRLAKIERALHPPPPKAPEPDGDGSNAKDFKRGGQSFTRAILGEVIKAIQPALLSMLTAGVTAHAAKPSEEEIKAVAAKEDQDQAAGPAGGGGPHSDV
jgi:hypothetical protein